MLGGESGRGIEGVGARIRGVGEEKKRERPSHTILILFLIDNNFDVLDA